MKTSIRCSLALAVLVGAVAPHAALAQAYPTKPVRIVVPAAPGGGLDLVARNVNGRLSQMWGQQVIVENKPGANFIVGTDSVAKSAPDGYTLLVVSYGAITVNPLAYPDLPYNPERDLTPIMLMTNGPFVLLVNNAVPAATLPEFVAHLQANPGKLNHASNSASTILASELFKSLAKVSYVDVNYKGGILAAASTSAGETQFAIVDSGSAGNAMRGGLARALAVTPSKRFKLLPNLPTFAEAGVPGYSASAWVVLLAPAKTPADIIAKVSNDVRAVLATPEVAARIEGIGNEVVASSPEETARVLRADAEQWSRLVKERNIRLQ
jgi:tripartite-type tricarboxylate transporter receptor subunit TctC